MGNTGVEKTSTEKCISLKTTRPALQLSQMAAQNWEYSLDARLGSDFRVSVDLYSVFKALSSTEERITEEKQSLLFGHGAVLK